MSTISYVGQQFNPNTVIKIAGIKYRLKELISYTSKGLWYILKHDGIYQIFYSQNAGFHSMRTYTKKGLIKRGRHMLLDSKQSSELSNGYITNLEEVKTK